MQLSKKACRRTRERGRGKRGNVQSGDGKIDRSRESACERLTVKLTKGKKKGKEKRRGLSR